MLRWRISGYLPGWQLCRGISGSFRVEWVAGFVWNQWQAWIGNTQTAEPTPGRGYSHADVETMFVLGKSNATASVVVLALYINGSDEVSLLYSNPQILWLLCLLLLYWTNRTWVGARRGKIDDDPVVFAIKDRVSQLVGVASLLVVLAARHL